MADQVYEYSSIYDKDIKTEEKAKTAPKQEKPKRKIKRK